MSLRISVLGSMVALAVAFGGVVTSAEAVTVSATETIADSFPFDIFSRDLTRTRTDSSGTVVETNDATIIAQNLVDGDFGITNTDDVSFRHDLNWVNPALGTVLVASLQIDAFGPLGSNDTVTVDNINLGSLNNGIFTTTVFSSSNPVTLSLLFADGLLNVFINKNDGANFLGQLNAVSVYSSSLTVRYESGEVPEPATAGLFGLGLLGLAAVRRRKAA